MKTILKLTIFLITFLAASCDPEPVLIESNVGTPNTSEGFYILCEGLFNQNNSTLAYYDKGELKSDIFFEVNKRKLGDTANDMLLYGNKLYIAVSESGTIEILQAGTAKSLGVIDMKTNGKSREPRNMIGYADHVYVCNFDGTVSRIDTLTLKIDGDVSVGRNPDGITEANGKLYISNSGGMDFSNPDSTISVVDIKSFTEIKKIPLRANPGRICSDGHGNVFVISRGIFDYDKMDYDTRLHKIDTDFDEVSATFKIPVLDMAINGTDLFFCGYGSDSIGIMDINTGNISNKDFIRDDIRIEHLYSIDINHANGQVYICDAHDYVTPGTIYCFDQSGNLNYSINNVGINPNGIMFGLLTSSSSEPGTEESQKGVSKVLEYCPAPGQFVNLIPKYEDGDDAISMANKCLTYMNQGYAITLGGFGGYITVGFDTPIKNVSGTYDFEIYGNSFSGNAEPGVVWVSTDNNGNGLADDEWFEIAGSEHQAGRAESGYSVTYQKPSNPVGIIYWTDSHNNSGSIDRLDEFHAQSYWPQWIDQSSISLQGTLLQDKLSYINGIWTSDSFEWGYADNCPNESDGSKFNIDWAIDSFGQKAELQSIDFIKVVTAVNNKAPLIGELSTEISNIKNLHNNK